MKWIYVAHIPYVLVFLFVAMAVVCANWPRRRRQ